MSTRKASVAKKPAKRKPTDNRVAKIATGPTPVSVAKFIDAIEHPTRREDVKTLAKLFALISGHKPRMWGGSIVGFGQYHYVYDTGREGDLMRIGFSPRRQNLVIYIIQGFRNSAGLLAKLGKHKIGKSCLYVNKLEDVDLHILERLAGRAWSEMSKRYPG